MIAHSIRILTVTLVGALLAACGGGGGSSNGSNATQPVQQTGTVTLALSDGIIEEYDQVLMDIEEIRFLSDGGQDILVLDEPVLVDFLALQNFSEVLLRREVVAGTYGKIRLILNSLTLVKLDADGLVLDEDVVRLNGLRKVDINPRGPFTVRGGEELLIDIDVDLDKSIHVVRAGNSGRIRFRPVIFASIISRTADQKLFRVEGTVESTAGGAAGTFTVCDIRRAFADGLNRPEPADICVTVNPDDSTPYFDFAANPDTDRLAVNDHVVVYGKFPTPDELVPAVVASGSQFETRRGLAASEFRPLTGDFLLGDFGASDDTCFVDPVPLRVELADGAPAFVEYPGTSDESALADLDDLAALPLLCRRTEVEGSLVDLAEPADQFLRAFILLLGSSQQGVVELEGTLAEKVDADPATDAPNDYVLDMAGEATDPVIVASDTTRIVRISAGATPDEIVTEDATLAELPVDPEVAEATVYGIPREDGVIDATFILLDETTADPI